MPFSMLQAKEYALNLSQQGNSWNMSVSRATTRSQMAVWGNAPQVFVGDHLLPHSTISKIYDRLQICGSLNTTPSTKSLRNGKSESEDKISSSSVPIDNIPSMPWEPRMKF